MFWPRSREDKNVIFSAMTTLSLILYTAGNSPNSVQAVSNIKAMCAANFPDHHRIEIVDLLQDPQRGRVDGIIVTPTLMRVTPEPKQMIMGNLSDTARVLRALTEPTTTQR
jgi:circadian clock protein KaiB